MQKWLEIVDRDIDAAEWMQQGGRWLYVAFECHQALEKVIKAFWCGTRDDDPLICTTIGDCWKAAG
jgi:HEPN domain-containing protein